MNWFYEYNGEQKGPVSDGELDRLVTQGIVAPTTLVWRDGLPNWTPLAQARPGGPAMSALAAPGLTQCESCGRFFEGPDLVQIAGRNICAGCKPAVLQGLQQGGVYSGLETVGRVGPAWEQRETLGTYAAARDTIKAVLFRPTETFSTMKVDGGISKPFWFHLIFGGLGNFLFLLLIGLALLLVFTWKPDVFFPQGAPNFTLPGAVAIIFITIFLALYCFLVVAINSFVQSGIWHFCLMVLGGARRPYETTFRAICYSSGAVLMLNCIPVVGIIFAIPWSIVVTCIALAKAHETDLWRAVVAIFLPSIVCCGLQLVFMILAGGLSGLQNAH